MNDQAIKQAIKDALGGFAKQPVQPAALALLETLGYTSKKRVDLKPNTPANFLKTFAEGRAVNPKTALTDEWQSVDFLFQLTGDEIKGASQEQFVFESKGKYGDAIIESYLFFGIVLKGAEYSRTQLSGITREVNKLFKMPVMILFKHGDTLTLSVINRRLHKRDESRDVLEKVTLIKDIRFANPHRAHIEILFDLSLDALHDKHAFTNFVALHAAWQKTLDSSELNKRFFLDVANWYFWALNHIEFPKDAPKQDGKDHISIIRLITRLMFCWFVKEKGLVPDTLFDERKLPQILNGFAPTKAGDKESVFYKAILQNLFFATLNTEMDKRGWTKEEQNFMAHSLYRHRELFQKANEALDLFKNIPFLNGGLFECLDKDLGENAKPRYVRIDGFSRREDSQPTAPDFLFFGPEREVDLSEAYGDTKFKKVKVRGLIHTFEHYKFTVAENTPIEEEIALDPELSGKVFENLLAAYNPETGATARKQTGSFYTPREIVNYMVDEALIACLKTKLETALPSAKDVEARLRHLFAYNDEAHKFTSEEVDALIAAIDTLKSLDPAVGSGAFPMGILHKLVFILGKLDPRNEKWKERQIARVRDAMATAEKIEDATVRERAVRELEQQITGINDAFEHNELDYGRKLYLIENCIYGVDIQPIAVQIAKMRFFISLIVDQKIDDAQPNRGVRPLPNLETKFVAANTLIGIDRPGQQLLRNREIDAKEASLRGVRRDHFLARSPSQKRKCREQDAKLRAEIAELLKHDGWDSATARKLASWDPYDQNASADFFDPEWMFGITDGFDVVTGNPPYVRPHKIDPLLKQYLWKHLKTFVAKSDLYSCFMERGLEYLAGRGLLSFIVPHTWTSLESFFGIRKLFATKTQVLRLVQLPTKVFDDATVETCIFLVQKHDSPSADHEIQVERLAENGDRAFVRRFFQAEIPRQHLHNFQLYAHATTSTLGDKLKAKAVGLKTLVDFVYGFKTADDDRFVLSQSKNKDCKLFIRSAAIHRYYYDPPAEFVWYVPEKMVANRKTARPGDRQRFEAEKIMVSRMGKQLIAAYDGGGLYVKDAMLLLKKPETDVDLHYLIGILNSRLLGYYYSEYFITIDVLKNALLALPIIPIAESDSLQGALQSRVVGLVKRILAQKAKNTAADTSGLEREIDQEVYALYGLTAEEIKIVEGAAAGERRG